MKTWLDKWKMRDSHGYIEIFFRLRTFLDKEIGVFGKWATIEIFSIETTLRDMVLVVSLGLIAAIYCYRKTRIEM